ncbi:hypothetical protein JCM10207_002929 [Rhodosporidiobolus poonsookiae]
MERYPPSSPTLETHPLHHARGLSSSRASPSPRARTSFANPPASSAYDMPVDYEKAAQRTGGRRGHGGLPMYSGAGGGAAGRGGAVGWISGRMRSGRMRWVLLGVFALGLWVWSSSESPAVQSSGAGADAAEKGEVLALASGTTRLDLATPPPPPPTRPRPPHPEEAEVRPPKPPVRPPKPAPPPSRAKPVDLSPIDMAVRPPASLSDSPADSNEKLLAYSPHSGYHNQRISLENALTLAFLLKRTLLLPPIWFGHAIPYISFDKIQRRLEMASKEGLDHCIEYGEGSTADSLPPECDGYFDWTLVDWSFLVDLSGVEKLVPIKRRWNMTTAWLDEELGLRRTHKRNDVFELKDDTMYQYRFYDDKNDDEPLEKWGNRIDIDAFREQTESFKLVHVGTMFGTARIRATLDETFDARSAFRTSMVFRTEIVDTITAGIRDLLGGAGSYYGLHLRVGDGVFQKQAKENMHGVWQTLCVSKMGLDQEVCDEVKAAASGIGRLRERDANHAAGVDVASSESSAAAPALVKRANSRPQRPGTYDHAPLPPLPTIRTLSDSPLSSTLACRGNLHTEPHLLPFNAPLYIATDSKLGPHDPNLALFFRAFPCTFVLSDFGAQVPELDRLNRLRNKDDKTPLGSFLYPQLDAQIAAWGRGLVGTPQSTYSRFAVDVLHQVYHGWEIINRG